MEEVRIIEIENIKREREDQKEDAGVLRTLQIVPVTDTTEIAAI